MVWTVLVMLVAMPLAFASPRAEASGVVAAPARYGELSQSDRIRAIRGFVEAGDLDTAELLLANSYFDEGDLGYQAAFLQTVVLERRNRLEEAEVLARAILAERPNYDLVRMQLARILVRRGNASGATYHLQLLSDSSIDPTARERFESFIETLDAGRPFTFGGFVSIAPSTNVNNGSNSTQIMLGGLPFTIDPEGQAQSGVGARIGANIGYTHALSERAALYAAGSTTFSDYGGSEFDTIVGDIRLGVRHRNTTHTLGGELIADRRWFSTTPTDYGLGARVFGSYAVLPQVIASGEVLFIDRTYDDAPAAATQTWRASGRLAYYPSASLSVYGGSGLDWEQADERPHNGYDGGFVEIGMTGQFGWGLTTSVQAKVGRREYEADFPGMTEPRADAYFELRGGLLKRDLQFGGFTPRLGATYYSQDSNVALYDYDKTSLDISLTREF